MPDSRVRTLGRTIVVVFCTTISSSDIVTGMLRRNSVVLPYLEFTIIRGLRGAKNKPNLLYLWLWGVYFIFCVILLIIRCVRSLCIWSVGRVLLIIGILWIIVLIFSLLVRKSDLFIILFFFSAILFNRFLIFWLQYNFLIRQG